MMSYKQYQVACGGVREQIKMAQKLHCPHMERKYKFLLKMIMIIKQLLSIKVMVTVCFVAMR